MMMFGLTGMFVFGPCGRMVFSLVKTDLNWLFRISAFSLLSDSSLLSLVRVGIPIVSTFKLLMWDQSRLCESEQIDEIYLLCAVLVSSCVVLHALQKKS